MPRSRVVPHFTACFLWILAVAALGQAPIPTEVAKLLAADGAQDDELGTTVAMDGDRVLVAAPGHDQPGTDAGAAYLYERGGGTWTQVAKLTASDAAAGDFFGTQVDLSGDFAIVGARENDSAGLDAGAAYVFENRGGAWTEVQKLIASDASPGDFFGFSVALDGSIAVVGARFADGSGAAYVFTESGGTWTEVQKLSASDGVAGDEFGWAAALSGTTVLVSARLDDTAAGGDAGSVYVFTESGGTWSETQRLEAPDASANDVFGWSVALDGSTAVVGSFHDGDLGANSGSAYVFTENGGSWSASAKLTASDGAANDEFGITVGVSGDLVVVGAALDDDGGNNTGSAYLFVQYGDLWVERAKITASDAAADDQFGTAVSVSGARAVVTARLTDDLGPNSGAAYVFEDLRQVAASALDVFTEDFEPAIEFRKPQGSPFPPQVLARWHELSGGFVRFTDDHATSFCGIVPVGLAFHVRVGGSGTRRLETNDVVLPAGGELRFTLYQGESTPPPLSLDPRCGDRLEVGDEIFVSASFDGGSTWTPVVTIGPYPGEGRQTYSYGFGPASMVRFRWEQPNFSSGSPQQGGDHWGLDDVIVLATAVDPTALFSASPQPAMVGAPVDFDGAASFAAPGRTLVSYDWDYGDGSGQTTGGPASTHTYATTGAYTVMLTVTDDVGGTNTTQSTLMVVPASCGGVCGDCNLSSTGPDILDSLMAAQIAVGLVTSPPAQASCCDVNDDGAVNILDSLRMAQSAAGLPVMLLCP